MLPVVVLGQFAAHNRRDKTAAQYPCQGGASKLTCEELHIPNISGNLRRMQLLYFVIFIQLIAFKKQPSRLIGRDGSK